MPSAGRKVSLMRHLEKYFKVYPGGLAPQATASCCLAGKGRFVELPPLESFAFGAELLAAVRRIGIQVVLPVRNEDMRILEALREDLFLAGAVLIQSPLDTTEVCIDKMLLHERLRNSGIHTPDTCEAEDFESIIESKLPVFIKPRHGSGSKHAQIVRTRQELDLILEHHKDMIVQPYIKGQEYTVDMFFDRGRLIQHVLRRRLSVTVGQMDAGVVCEDLDLDSYREAIDIGRHLVFQGPLNMQFLLEGETCWVTDVNPRFAGGIGLSIAAGADFPAYLLELAVGGEVCPRPIKFGTRAISYMDYVCG